MPTIKKLKMQTPNKVDENREKLRELFPHAVSENKIDFDLLRQILSEQIVEGNEERYRLDWPGKKASLLKANSSINKTLRPCREESVDFDNTQNLYIEGDNFEVLKLLSESYLGKIKMIYIDPPYNTGKDFVYRDNFTKSKSDYEEEIGLRDEDENKLFKNTDSNGRFHSDWLSMMYERLLVARDLLKEDGVIFISIDDNEVHNLRKICDEVFGEGNFVGLLPTIMNLKGNNDEFGFAGTHEFTVVYIKDKSSIDDLFGIPLEDDDIQEYKLKDEIGLYKKGATLMRTGEAGGRKERPKGYYPVYVDKSLSKMSVARMNDNDYEIYPKTQNGKEMSWRRSKENLAETINEFIITGSAENISFYKKQRLEEAIRTGKKAKSLFYKPKYSSGNGTLIIKNLFNDRIFDNPKPLDLIKDFISVGSKDGIILDFFSGSATTAHAVMQRNAEDGGNRKFIMIQLPEATDEKSEAYKEYKNICEIGKERIRRAGQKILNQVQNDENKTQNYENKIQNDSARHSVLDTESQKNLDIGFRVLKIDSTNFKDVYYHPNNLTQKDIFDFQTNIKEERTDLDLLFQIMLDLGIELSLKITPQTVDGTKIYMLENNELIACLEDNISLLVIAEIKKLKPYQVVLKDGCFKDDNDKINAVQELSSVTTVSVL